MEREEDRLDGEGDHPHDVLDAARQRNSVVDHQLDDAGQAEREEHRRVLAVADVNEFSVLVRRDDLADEADEGEKDLEEAFPLPVSQTAAEKVAAERRRRTERRSALPRRSVETTAELDRPPDGEDYEERSGEDVSTERTHLR